MGLRPCLPRACNWLGRQPGLGKTSEEGAMAENAPYPGLSASQDQTAILCLQNCQNPFLRWSWGYRSFWGPACPRGPDVLNSTCEHIHVWVSVCTCVWAGVHICLYVCVNLCVYKLALGISGIQTSRFYGYRLTLF